MIEPERLVKSSDRVRDLGEVFTPSATVDAMLDLLPDEVWTVNPPKTFLEPACGDGNFVVAVLGRKLGRIHRAFEASTLTGGATHDGLRFHALEAMASIYAVDISPDNIVGGTPGHEIGARARVVAELQAWAQALGIDVESDQPFVRSAAWIAEHNLIIGNMLSHDADGRPTRREEIPIIEYAFNPSTLEVTLLRTTLGDVSAEVEAEVSEAPTLFGPAKPLNIWSGKAVHLFEADPVAAPALHGPARNGTART